MAKRNLQRIFYWFEFPPSLQTDRIENDGYFARAYRVVTSDGYILQLHRIGNDTSLSAGNVSRVPVLLMHGLLETASSWIALGPEHSLGTYAIARIQIRIHKFLMIALMCNLYRLFCCECNSLFAVRHWTIRCVDGQCTRYTTITGTHVLECNWRTKQKVLVIFTPWNCNLRLCGIYRLHSAPHQSNAVALCCLQPRHHIVFHLNIRTAVVQLENKIDGGNGSGRSNDTFPAYIFKHSQ